MRAFLFCSGQLQDSYQLTYDHIDIMRKYTLHVLASGDKRLCYPLTDKERSSNDLAVTSKVNPNTPEPVE